MSKLASYFTTGTRDSGERFVRRADSCPEWLQTAIQEAHAGSWPNDWVYETCKAACEAIDDGSITDDDSLHEWADSYVDIYTHDLSAWYASEGGTDFYANAESEADEMGSDKSAPIHERLMVIQYCAIRAIASCIFQAYTDNADGES